MADVFDAVRPVSPFGGSVAGALISGMGETVLGGLDLAKKK